MLDCPKTFAEQKEQVKKGQINLPQIASDPIQLLANSVENAPQMLYFVGQIQFQVQLMSIMSVAQKMWEGYRADNDFILNKHIIACINQCSNLCKDHPLMTFISDDRLPDIVNGDQAILMLAIQTLTEFSLRYTANRHEDKIQLRTVFDGFQDDDNSSYLVSYQCRLPVNTAYDTKKILLLFKDIPEQKAGQNDDTNAYFLERQISLGKYFEEFGIGLLLLPSLAQILQGKLTIKLASDKRVRAQPRSVNADSSSVKSSLTTNQVNSDSKQGQSLIINF